MEGTSTAQGLDAPPDAAVAPAASVQAARRRRWTLDAAVLVGLAGVAITQPMLELLGSNPTFFVAGHYEVGQIIWFSVVVAVVPAAVVFALSQLAALARPSLKPVFHGVGVGALTSLFGLALCRSVRLDGVVYVVPVVIALGVVVAVAENRLSIVRTFLAYLALGNLAFVVLFLTVSPSAALLSSSGSAGQPGTVAVPPLDGPVIVVVLDEFPVTAIMRGDGTINDTRYPHLARLAERSTWFRNAASESRDTRVSVPTILSGARAQSGDLPIVDVHPRNYFSLFGDRDPVNRYEPVTDLCPSDVCEPAAAQSMSRLLDDASLVYRHRILPPDLREGLPPVDTGWGDFGGDEATPHDSPDTSEERDFYAEGRRIRDDETGDGVAGQAAIFRRQIELIDAEPSVNLIHVLLPHHPYRITPWGDARLTAPRHPDEVATGDAALPPPDDPAYDFRFRQVYAMQAMQIGAVDEMLGDMIDHLESTGAWDEALVVVTSDHGIDTTAPGFKRNEDETNTDELFRVPMFIKAPGQTQGAVDDAPASTVDVLPSIIDLLGIETDWDLEGHSLFDGSEPSIERHVRTGVDAAFRLAAEHEAQFPRGEDWVSLAAVGEGEDLVGSPVGDYQLGAPSPLSWAPDFDVDLDNVSVAHDNLPYVVEGTVSGSDGRPRELVIAVNDTLAGTIGGYLPAGDAWQFTGHLAPFFEDGRNEIMAYEVERTGDTITLHPLVT